MNITLSAEDRIVEVARSWAGAHGTSINALVRDFLAGLGSDSDREAIAGQFARNARTGSGRSDSGTRFTRRSTYAASRFGNPE
jgi:hypothetical protein